MIGETFGRLTIIREVEPPEGKRRTWYECECACGNTTIGYGTDIKRGSKRSCGCLRSKGVQEMARRNAERASREITSLRSTDNQFQRVKYGVCEYFFKLF